jgi:hypothetical protein
MRAGDWSLETGERAGWGGVVHWDSCVARDESCYCSACLCLCLSLAMRTDRDLLDGTGRRIAALTVGESRGFARKARLAGVYQTFCCLSAKYYCETWRGCRSRWPRCSMRTADRQRVEAQMGAISLPLARSLSVCQTGGPKKMHVRASNSAMPRGFSGTALT